MIAKVIINPHNGVIKAIALVDGDKQRLVYTKDSEKILGTSPHIVLNRTKDQGYKLVFKQDTHNFYKENLINQ